MAESTLILYDEDGNRLGEKPLLDLDTMTDLQLVALITTLMAVARARGLTVEPS